MSEKGYSSQIIGRQWIETVFNPQTRDITNFCSQFKHVYAQVLDDHAHENFGAMNKCTFLQAIEKPFLKSFTAENIKKSFEIVGLHPLNPNVIKTSQMAPSIPTGTNTTSLTDEPSPVKAMKAPFTSLLDNAQFPPCQPFILSLTLPSPLLPHQLCLLSLPMTPLHHLI